MNKTSLTLEEVRLLHQKGDFIEAKNGYLALLKLTPNDPNLLHMLAILYAEMGEFDESESCLEQALSLDPNNLSHALHLANIYKLHGLFSKAVATLQEVIKLNNSYAPAYNNLGTVYFAQAKLQSAIDAYTQALNLKPDYIDAYYNLGLAYTKAGQSEAAENAFKAVSQLAPDHPGAQFQLASLYMQLKKFPQAVEQFNLLIKTHPHHFETQSNLGTCYLQLGMLNEAKEHYLKALAINPPDNQVLFNLGVISMQQNILTDAIEFYQKLISYNNNHFDAQNNLAIAYLFLRKKEQSLFHFQEALRIQPNNEAIRHTIRILLQKKDVKDTPPEYVQALFDSYSDHYDAHMVQSLSYNVPEKFKTMLEKADAKKAMAGDILDLGCGTGLCAALFKSTAKSLTGVDLSRKMLEVAEEKRIFDIVIAADVIAFLKENKLQYDLILAGDLVVYFGEVETLLTLVAKAMQPKGYFIFNAEISHQENFYMTGSGRFAHLKAYLDHVIELIPLTIVDYQLHSLRTENGKAVKGHIYLLQKTQYA